MTYKLKLPKIIPSILQLLPGKSLTVRDALVMKFRNNPTGFCPFGNYTAP
jgi:hypothetical protein